MQAFLNGDNETAISHWKNSVSVAVENDEPPSQELAEVYFCLGKALSDMRRDEEAVQYLRIAVEMILSTAPGDHRLKTAQYALGEVLRRMGGEEEAARQFKQALDLPEHVSFSTIPLKKAIKELNNVGLAMDLKGGVLSSLCHSLDIDPDGDNADLVSLLVAYYTDSKHDMKRQKADRFFLEHFTDFDTDEVLERLCEFAGCPGFLVVEDQEGDTADGDFATITLRRNDGELICRACSSVVGVVDEFNNQLEVLERPFRFCSLNTDAWFSAYLLDIPVQQRLDEANALPFDEIFSD